MSKLNFVPSEFIAKVTASEFSTADFGAKRALRLQSARRAFLSLSKEEQARLALIADRIPGKTVRNYGPLTGFEILVACSMLIAREWREREKP